MHHDGALAWNQALVLLLTGPRGIPERPRMDGQAVKGLRFLSLGWAPWSSPVH